MRAAPACQFSLKRFGMWRAAVLLLAVLGAAAIAAWTIGRESPLASAAPIGAALALMALATLAASLIRMPPVDLRWDGRIWHLGPASGEPTPGELRVAIDLGSWMLLRFTPVVPDARPKVVWVPAQRRGLEPQWHALRCAVYSPRPAPAEDAPGSF